MQVHSVGERIIKDQIDVLKQAHVPQKQVQAFTDPIKEFARASNVESMVRNWLTYPAEERKRLVKDAFRFVPRMPGDAEKGVLPESDQAYEARMLERWRGLCVVLQEESRAKPGNRCVEAAIGAFKQLFPDYKNQEK